MDEDWLRVMKKVTAPWQLEDVKYLAVVVRYIMECEVWELVVQELRKERESRTGKRVRQRARARERLGSGRVAAMSGVAAKEATMLGSLDPGGEATRRTHLPPPPSSLREPAPAGPTSICRHQRARLQLTAE